MSEWPEVEYSIVPLQDRYQVQKQICVMDSIPDSPTKGTLSCSKNFVEGDGTVTVAQ